MPVRVRRGSQLLLQGEPGERVYFIRDGVISLSRLLPEEPEGGDGNGHVHALRGPGGMLGLEALCGEPYRATARTETDVKVCGASTARFVEWMAESPTRSMTVLRQVISADEPVAPRAPSLRGSSRARVAEYLLHDGASRRTRWRVVADLLGMRPETLSRCLEHLDSVGAIRRERGRVIERREERLRAIVRGELQ